MKIVTIIGARPQFIKAAAVSHAIQLHNQGNPRPYLREVIVHTGQHYDKNMSGVFFKELNIPQPHYNLGIGSGSHGQQTGRMLEAIEKVLMAEKPELVLVYGDTNSTLAGALAAAKLHIPVAHVEAGLRSFNRYMPEEINRVLTDHLAGILFAPTMQAVANLQAEGISPKQIYKSGDVMYDAALLFSESAEAQSRILDQVGLVKGEYILTTIHRAENTDDSARLETIFKSLIAVSGQETVVVPLHPRTRESLRKSNILAKAERCLKIIPPVGYLDMVMLEKNARIIITDSGGVQKEAYFYQVPCITVRAETEWVELVDAGWNRLVLPAETNDLIIAIKSTKIPADKDTSIYGENASAIVVEIICQQGFGGN